MENKVLSAAVLLSHDLALSVPSKNLAVDATLGNGHDTLFLAEHFQNVIGFDIQALAIRRSTERLKDFSNVGLIRDSFLNIQHYVKQPIDLLLFNLGFLPGGDRHITTKVEEVVLALDKLLPLLSEGGHCIIVVYPKHNDNYDLPVLKTYLDEKKKSYQIFDELASEVVLFI